MAVKGAIVGFGHIAANGHVPAYKRNSRVKICAVFDSCPDRKKVNDELLPESRFYSCIDELFRYEDIDFIDVATPPALHAPYILEALKNGKHVLCEKPLVLEAEDLQMIWQGMQEAGRTVVTVHNWRYSPITQKISDILSSGQIGRPLNIEYTVIRTRPSVAVGEGDGEDKNWRLDPSIAGGGILVDHGWHAFYLVNEWMGAEPTSLECRLENRKYVDIPVEDTAIVEVDYGFGNNARAQLFFTWAGEKRENRIRIEAQKGVLSCLDDRIIVEDGKESFEITFDEGLSSGSHHPEWYNMVIDEFLEEMEDRYKRSSNFREAANCFNMLFHCKVSNEKGCSVTVLPWQQMN